MLGVVTSDELEERMAQVSHATYLVQAVRDQNKRLPEITTPPELDFEETEERLRDLAVTEEWLVAVLAGGSLEDHSDQPGHLPTPHDRERAKNAVKELTRLGLLS
jgi:hypothetical protein